MFSAPQKIYFIVIGVAFLCSLISFRLHYSRHLQFFSIFIGISAITELIANRYLKLFNLHVNHPVYNVFFLMQLFSMGYFYDQLIRSKWFKKIMVILIVVYLAFWIYTCVGLHMINQWNPYAAMFGNLITIIFACRYLFEIFTANELVPLKKYSNFWITIGILLFYCCSLPIFGAGRFVIFHIKDNSLAKKVFSPLPILATSMYLIFIYAYICQINFTIKKSIS